MFKISFLKIMAMIFMVRGAFDLTGTMSLGWEDPLEKEMATHSSILAWEISWTEESGGLQSMRLQRVGTQLSTWTQTNQKKPLGETLYRHYSPAWHCLSPDAELRSLRGSRDSTPSCQATFVFPAEPLDIMEQKWSIPNSALSKFLTHRIYEHNRIIVLCH